MLKLPEDLSLLLAAAQHVVLLVDLLERSEASPKVLVLPSQLGVLSDVGGGARGCGRGRRLHVQHSVLRPVHAQLRHVHL